MHLITGFLAGAVDVVLGVLTFAILSLPQISVFLLFAIGIVVIYRASRVLNLAHGVMAMVPAYLYHTLCDPNVHIKLIEHVIDITIDKPIMPPPLAALVAVAGGALLGIITERFVVRRLRPQGPTAQTVGTVAVFGLGVALVAKMYGAEAVITAPLFPPAMNPTGSITIPFSQLGFGLLYAQVYVFAIGVAATGALFALFRFTPIGLAMRGAADNRQGAMLMGVDVERTTMTAWALGGGLAGLAGVLVGSLTSIHPFNLSLQVLPAFVATLIGGLESLPGAVWGSAVVGIVQGEVPELGLLPVIGPLANSAGFSQLVLMVVTFATMLARSSKLAGARVRAEIVGAATAVQGGLGKRPRHVGWLALVVALVIAVFPFIPQNIVPFSYKQDVVVAASYLMAALSVVLLTGWVGQISLAQAEFVGVGAFFTAVLANQFHISFPASFVLAALAGAAVAGALGIVALRVRGLYLAVATLVFAWMADKFLFNASWFGIVGGSATIPPVAIGSPGTIPYLDFTDIKVLYLAFASIAAGMIYGLANLRESKTGRAFFAVRGSEVAAASLGIDVTRYKLLAFLVAGGIAGAAGNLSIVQGSAVPDSFNFLTSLFFLSVAVVGGLFSLGGAVAAALVFAGLHEVFLRVHALNGFLEIVAALVLLVVLLVYPGGLAAVPTGVARVWRRLEAETPLGPFVVRARRFLEPAGRRLRAAADGVRRVMTPPRRWIRTQVNAITARAGDAIGRLVSNLRTTTTVAVAPASPAASTNGSGPPVTPAWEGFVPKKRPGVGDPRPERTVLQVSEVTVRFGGLTAVSEVNLGLREGEIVGLIGANGAGKTTLYNVISGLVTPVAGRVQILGQDVTKIPVHRRARLGIARTFQEIQLFPQLSVFENLMVATHLRNSSKLHQHVLVTGGGLKSEAAARARVRAVLDFLGLRHLADRRITDVSFGLLRMVEVARALVTGAQVILLDEPASGLDNVESDRLTQLLLYIREELSVSMLVVEHDIRTVLALSDYMYVLDQGELIGEGRPEEVQRSKRVIEAYLGEAVA